MKICELATATDLICRRGKLIGWQRAVERGDYGLTIGGEMVGSAADVGLREMLTEMLGRDLARNEAQLAELGVEVDIAEESAGLPPLRLEASRTVAASR